MILAFERGGQAQSVEFDTLIHGSRQRTSTVTTHPVEKGAPVADHVRPPDDRLSVEAIVSNTPLDVPPRQGGAISGGFRSLDLQFESVKDGRKVQINAAPQVLQFDSEFDRIRDVWNDLKDIQDNNRLVAALTTYRNGLDDLEDMVLQNLTAPREAADGTCQTFTFDLVKLRIVETKKVATPAPTKTRKKQGKKGKEEVTDEKKQEELRSGAHKLIHDVLGISF